MTEIDRACEHCGKVTKHTVTPFYIPSVNPTIISSSNKSIDLTGRSGPPVTVTNTLPQTIEYKCKECGHLTVEAGPIQKQSGDDAFSGLKRGSDWTEPK
jgi:rRNA maturation protein Nop10